MGSIQEICKTYHDAVRVTNFAISLAPFGILRSARVKALRPEVLVQSIDALYAEITRAQRLPEPCGAWRRLMTLQPARIVVKATLGPP